jgi:hypothetical protein
MGNLTSGESLPLLDRLPISFSQISLFAALAGAGNSNAMVDGVQLLTWSKDSFAYADSFDEKEGRYRGLRCGQMVVISANEPTGLLVKPDVAAKQQEAERPPASPAPTGPGAPPAVGGPVTGGSSGAPAPQLPKRFHGSVRLDATRVGRDVGRIAEEVISPLTAMVGSEVKVTLEIEAQVPNGVPENIVRTVTENSRTLKFDTQGFEKA